MELVEIDWRVPLEAFADITLVMLGTAWDYQDHAEEFAEKLEALAKQGTIVCNSPDVVRWNADKRYLENLASAGAQTVPTLWHDNPLRADIVSAFDHFGIDRVVAKRRVGAGALGQHSFTPANLPPPDWQMGHAAMIQPFLPSVEEEGEYSFVFIDGEFSHGVLKRPARGDYRVQSLFGGMESHYTPARSDLARAKSVVDAIPFSDLLYCRIDMLRLPNGELAVMEAEMIEPYLYPEQGPGLGKAIAKAITSRLAKA